MSDNIETIICETEIATANFLPEGRLPLCASKEAILEAIFVSQGNLTRASKLLNCAHSALHTYVKKDEKLKEYVNRVLEYRNDVRADVLEDLAFNKALYGDTTLIWKLLCTYGSSRGYGDKQQIDVKHDIPPHIKTMLESLSDSRKQDGTESKTEDCPKEGSKKN